MSRRHPPDNAVTSLSPEAEADIARFVADCYADPLAFVLGAYPWGKAGTSLAQHDGPDKWQIEVLEEIGGMVRERGFDGTRAVRPIRKAISSGHGIGKSTLAAWIVDWIMSTRPHAQGTITANTMTQLQTKTWAAIQRWTKLCITAAWFIVNSERMYHRAHKESWFCALQNSKKENSEAFAGQHAADSTSFYILDEASAIDEAIYQVAEGGLTDGEPMIFLFGNPTRNTGAFHAAVFGAGRDKWHPTIVDARDAALTNKDQIEEWRQIYGEDSDFFRVRVRGLPPRGSDIQFIDHDRVWLAQRNIVTTTADEPLIVGVDCSDGGAAWNVARFRCGLDARSIPPIRMPGEKVRLSRDPWLVQLANILDSTHGPHRRKVDAMFVDSAFGAPYVELLKGMGYQNVYEIRFGADCPLTPDMPKCANMRAWMWQRLRDWLPKGSIDPHDARLETDLTAPGWHLDKQDRIVLESKESMQKRGIDSPDDADALALTFAMPVRRVKRPGPKMPPLPIPPRGSGWLGH